MCPYVFVPIFAADPCRFCTHIIFLRADEVSSRSDDFQTPPFDSFNLIIMQRFVAKNTTEPDRVLDLCTSYYRFPSTSIWKKAIAF